MWGMGSRQEAWLGAGGSNVWAQTWHKNPEGLRKVRMMPCCQGANYTSTLGGGLWQRGVGQGLIGSWGWGSHLLQGGVGEGLLPLMGELNPPELPR